MLRENKGVTLVALVITIIVLLILAGVSISLVVGDNGVLNQAVNAADNTNAATARDEIGMAVSSCVTEYLAGKYEATSSSNTITYYLTNEKLSNNMSTFKVEAFSWSGSAANDAGDTATITLTSKTNSSVQYNCTLTITSTGNSCTVGALAVGAAASGT